MSNKVILVVLDGLNYQVACDCMGYLNGLLELSDSKNSIPQRSSEPTGHFANHKHAKKQAACHALLCAV